MNIRPDEKQLHPKRMESIAIDTLKTEERPRQLNLLLKIFRCFFIPFNRLRRNFNYPAILRRARNEIFL